MLLLRGPLGVGKTTVAARLGEELRAEVVSIDRILEDHRLEEWDVDRLSLRSFRRANEFAADRITENRGTGRSTIVEGNFYWTEQVDELIARAREPVMVATLTAPLAVCLARDGGRPPPLPGTTPRAGDRMGEQAVRAVYALVGAVDRGTPIDAGGPLAETVRRLRRLLMS